MNTQVTPPPADDQTDAVAAAAAEDAADTKSTPERNLDVDGPDEKWTLEDLEHLSEAEQKALMASQEPAEPEPDTKAEAEAAAAKAKADADAKAAAEAAPKAPAPPPEQQEQPQGFDINAARKGIDGTTADMAALRAAYNDGKIDDEAFEKQLDTLIERKSGLQAGIKVAQVEAQRANEATQDAYWNDVEAYQASNPDLWNDANLPLWNDILVATNKRFAGSNVSTSARLKLAHQEFNSIADTEVPLLGRAPETAPETAPVSRQKPDAKPIPPNIAAMPASDGGLPEGRFAAVDAAVQRDVYAGEAAIAQMTEAQMDAWLKAG